MPEIPGAGVFREVLERERLVQREMVGRVLAPVDAVFDILEGTGGALRAEAEAIGHAAAALQQAAGLMQRQAEIYERAVLTLRTPSRAIEAVAGVDRTQS